MNNNVELSSPAGDHEQITVSNVAIGPTATKVVIHQAGGFHKRAVACSVTVTTNSIRYRYDGTAPTAAVGHQVVAGGHFEINGEGNVANLKMIAVAADGLADVTYHYTY